MRQLISASLFLRVIQFFSSVARGQTAEGSLTLHATASAVVVDVVVKDKEHRAVHGLTQADFIISEDKKPQAVAGFEEHTARAVIYSLPKMPPGVFTNMALAPAGSAVNVILIDSLNTPLTDQAFMRDQILKFVNGPEPLRNVAIFGLSMKLRMLQGFSSDPAVLRGVVNRQFGKTSPLLADQIGGSGVPDSISDVMSSPANSLMPAEVVAAMQTLEDSNNSLSEQIRVRYTLDELNQLARYLAAIPGRKNLIWFSGNFPIDILPAAVATGADDHFATVADAEAEYRETAALLSRSQVAVYPIDAGGLTTSPTTAASSAGSRYAGNPRNFNKDELNYFEQQASGHATMARMAEDTGGKAFYKTNDLAQAVHDAIDDGSNYYTLVYTPANNKSDGGFRRIDVKLTKESGCTLEYRRGYFTDKPVSGRKALVAGNAGTVTTAEKAMLHGVPPATQILYKVLIQPATSSTESHLADRNVTGAKGYAPANPPYRRLVVAFAVAPGDLAFSTNANGMREANLNFVSMVYQPDGLLVCTRSDTLTVKLNDADFRKLVQGGLRFTQEISVPDKGDYSLRTGVYDIASNRLGSMETTVDAVKNLAPVKP
jgi:VWFA-related protein